MQPSEYFAHGHPHYHSVSPQGGNRVEFRAVGSSQSVAVVQAFLTVIVADSLDYIAQGIEEQIGQGLSVEQATEQVIREVFATHQRIIFNGDGYSEEWVEEAAKRGLANITNSADAIKQMVNPETIALMTRTGVLRENEFLARQRVAFEHLALYLQLEAVTTRDLASRYVIAASFLQQERLANAIIKAQQAGVPSSSLQAQLRRLQEVAENLDAVIVANEELTRALDACDVAEGYGEAEAGAEEAVAFQARDTLVPAMNKVREYSDKLEHLVDSDLWKLPTYEELLQNTQV